jgi:CheY-like chemotaxis protein
VETTRILIIDDEAGFTRVVKAILERRGGFEVLVDNHGNEACRIAEEFRPDLILLDIQMPKANGFFIAHDLQNIPALSGIPIVYVTGIVRKESTSPHKSLGGYPFLAKPVGPEELFDCIRENLKAKPAQGRQPSG